MDAVKTRRIALVATTAAGIISMGVAPAAGASPTILSTGFDRGAVAGRSFELRVGASDPSAPVTGMVVGFGAGEGGAGISSCLPPDSAGHQVDPTIGAGRRVTLAAPHTYSTAGPRALAASLSSGGCTATPTSTLQPLIVNVPRQGGQPAQPVAGPPLIQPLGSPTPLLPGLGQLPAAPLVPAAAAAACPGSGLRFKDDPVLRRTVTTALVCLLNRERRARGLRPVRANPRLSAAALGHSRAMVRRRFFAHVGPGRSVDLPYRLRRTHYIPRSGGVWRIGENIGFGNGSMSSAAGMNRAWMHSTPHRHAILQPKFHEVGIGVYPGEPYGRGGATFTLDFGSRR
jgi:uncharacterized protein YkwD